jgi:hypothetical protein
MEDAQKGLYEINKVRSKALEGGFYSKLNEESKHSS